MHIGSKYSCFPFSSTFSEEYHPKATEDDHSNYISSIYHIIIPAPRLFIVLLLP